MSPGSFEFAWGPSSGRHVHPGSLWFTMARQMVVGLIRVLFGRFWGLSHSFGFVLVHSRGHRGCRVHWDWLGFAWALLGVVGFIRVHFGTPGNA